MIEFGVRGDFGPLMEQIDALSRVDLAPLAARIREIMVADNARARAEGHDDQDRPFAPLRGGRPLSPSEVRQRGGAGPPLAPRGAASRIISGFEVELVPLDSGSVLARGSWPSFPELQYHVQGAGRLPVRDPIGLTPRGRAEVEAVVAEFVSGLAGGQGGY